MDPDQGANGIVKSYSIQSGDNAGVFSQFFGLGSDLEKLK
jgi:hypothetical protein